MGKIVLFGCAIVVVSAGLWFVLGRQEVAAPMDQASVSEMGRQNGTGTAVVKEQGEYTLAEVARHTDRASCWAVVRGEVYDLTAAIDKHPGGPDQILGLCGKDGTATFERKHGGQENPEALLREARIGVLTP